MIFVTRMDKQQMYLNPDHIVSIEETPDTVIALFNGNHFIIKERAHVVIARIIAFRARVIRRASTPAGRKYLARAKKSLYVNSTRNRDLLYPGTRDEQLRSPFHTQDI
jgi:flagellar protein FlbD